MFKKLKTLNLQKLFKIEKLNKRAVILPAVIAIIAANLLLSPIGLRLDLSKGRAYTLSSSTKKILRSAKSPIDLTFYVSSDIPARLVPLKTEVVDILNEFKRQSSKVQVKVIDPKKDPKAAQQAQNIGVPELQFSQLEQDKYNVSSSMFGIGIQYGTKNDVIPQVTDTSGLEYSLTSAIYRLTRTSLPKVGILGDANSFNPQTDQIATLRNTLSQQVDIEDVDVSTESGKIDPSYKTLLVFDNNQKTYNDEEVRQLKDYINNGGKAIIFADGVWVPNDLNGSATEAKHGLFGLLKDYGLTLNRNLLLSNSYELVNFGNGVVSFVSPYPYWLKTAVLPKQAGNFGNSSHLTLPWVSSVTIGKKDGYFIEPIVDSVSQTWQQTKNFTLFPQNIKEPNEKDYHEFNLIVQSQSKKNDGGTIVLIPTSRFANQDFIMRSNDNLEFIMNYVDNLASSGALSGIRNRQVDFYALPTLNDSQKNIFKYSTIFLLPVLFALYGAVRILKRK